jgi:lipoic acid synthetase
MSTVQAPSRTTPGTHQRNAEKLSRIPVKVVPSDTVLRKPEWIRIKLTGNEDVQPGHCLLRIFEIFNFA